MIKSEWELTSPGRTGANHMCLPSWVLFTPSINLSGVRTSPVTLSSTFTLSGNAAMSNKDNAQEDSFKITQWILYSLRGKMVKPERILLSLSVIFSWF